MRSVERTVSGFAKDSNLKSQAKAKDLIEALSISSDQKSYISTKVKSTMNFEIDDGAKVEEEFEDLGSSKRLKAIDKGFLDTQDLATEQGFSLPALDDFESKWFPFLSTTPKIKYQCLS